MIWASSMKRAFLPASVWSSRYLTATSRRMSQSTAEERPHAASGDFLLNDVTSSFFVRPARSSCTERWPARLARPHVPGLRRHPPSFGQAAVGAVDLSGRDICQRLVECWDDERLLAGRAFRRATGELVLDLELHAATEQEKEIMGGLGERQVFWRPQGRCPNFSIEREDASWRGS